MDQSVAISSRLEVDRIGLKHGINQYGLFLNAEAYSNLCFNGTNKSKH